LGGCLSATALCFSFFDLFTLSKSCGAGIKWRKAGATVLPEENASLFDYVHDNRFCLVVSLPVIFIGVLVIRYCLSHSFF
jgi:hypothetical protein